jgi:hypothetical protein
MPSPARNYTVGKPGEAFPRLEKGEQGGVLTRLADGPQLFSAVRR